MLPIAMTDATDTTATHQALIQAVDDNADKLLAVSHALHANPEIAFEEVFACKTLCAAVADAGLAVEPGVFTLDTAFESRFDGQLAEASEARTVAILAEYDALPGIGHACGHNLIATAALGAALALAAHQHTFGGTVRLIGTPAEEKGGGKELMARAGAFQGVDAAMMIHPSGVNLATMPSICVAEVEVVYHGRSAHASAMPHRGINALDGLLLAYQGISNLRQHIRDDERIHGIVTDGGQAPNIVPERAAGEFYVRAKNEAALARLKPRVQACFEAGAKASGCEVEVNWAGVDYLDINTNWPLAERFQNHGEALGREFVPTEKLGGSGSTDMGNVSKRLPSIHPMLACAPPQVVIHNPEFTKWSGSEMGDAAALDGAKAMALTAFDYLTSSKLQQDSRRALRCPPGLAKPQTQGQDFWLFGYGSLIWRPDIEYTEKVPATVHGWVRRFWQGSHDHRGTPDAPGRVVTLVPDVGGQCLGMAYRVSAANAMPVLGNLDFREKNGYQRLELPAVTTNGIQISTLTYIGAADNFAYLGDAPAAQISAQIAHSEGPSGHNRDYLFELADALRQLGADDPHVFDLERKVRKLTGHPG